MKTKRINSIDTFRGIAIIAIVAIHIPPFENNSFLYQTINQIVRFAVPFFFIVSGYFWKNHFDIQGVSYTKKYLKRLLLALLVFSLFYLLPYNIGAFFSYGLLGPLKSAYWHTLTLLDNPTDLIWVGTKDHLWFLISLCWIVLFTSLFCKTKNMLLLFIISIGLFVYGVLGKSYSLTEIGIQTAFNTRNFIFFGLIHYSIGCWFTQLKPNKTWLWKGLLLFTLGTTLHITELSLILHAHPDFNPIQDYLFSTILSGVGVALMALSEHPIVSSSTLLSKIGKESLGVFLIHFAVIDVITSLTTNDIVITIIGVPTTVIITYAIVTQVKKWFPRTRAFL